MITLLSQLCEAYIAVSIQKTEVETETANNGINDVISVSVRFPFDLLKSSVISVNFGFLYLFLPACLAT